jgi:hypothetical protein
MLVFILWIGSRMTRPIKRHDSNASQQSDDLETFPSAPNLQLAEQTTGLRLYLLYFKDIEYKPQTEHYFAVL